MKEEIGNVFPESILKRFEFYSYRNALTLMSGRYPEVLSDLLNTLEKLSLSKEMVRVPGGSRGPIVEHIDDCISDSWKREAKISADLNVKIQTKKPKLLEEYERSGFLDGHQIDYLYGKVALDIEWNSKDQTFDRDLYAMSAFYDAGAIDLGVILTRGRSIDETDFLKSLGNVLNKDGSEGSEAVYKKFGASTTTMHKLLYRLEAGRNGGCPILAIGIQGTAFS